MPRLPKGRWCSRRKRWRVQVSGVEHTLLYPSGDPIPRSDTKAAREAVRVLAGAARQERIEGPSCADLCRRYVDWLVEQGRAKPTVAATFRYLEALCLASWEGRPIAEHPAATLPPEAVYAVKPRGSKARLNFLSKVKACWRWGSEAIEGREPSVLIPVTALCRISVPAAGRREQEPPPWSLIRGMIALAWRWVAEHEPPRNSRQTLETRLRLVLCFELQAATGCRTHEAVGLRWDELRGDVVTISPSRVKTRGKGSSPRPRVFVVPPSWLAALEQARASGAWNPVWVFASPRRKKEPPIKMYGDWITSTLPSFARSVGFRWPEGFTPYSLRHALSTELYEAGESSGNAAAAAGHSPSVSEGTYRHARETAIRETFARLWRERGIG